MERLIVDMTVAPSGIVNAARDLQNSAGSATCSITWQKNSRQGKLRGYNSIFPKTEFKAVYFHKCWIDL